MMYPHGGFRGPNRTSRVRLSTLVEKRSHRVKRERDLADAYVKGRTARIRHVNFTERPYYKDANMEREWIRGWEEENANKS